MTKQKVQTSMNSRQAHSAIHVAALLFGLTGIFGELIQGSAWLITAGRAGFATVALLVFMRYAGQRLAPPSQRDLPFLILAGLLLAAHWIAFFVAVKIGGIAIATLGFASFPAFTTLLEGMLFRERPTIFEWGVVALVTMGLVLITPSMDLENQSTIGLLWAIASGLTFALFTLANRRGIQHLSASALACWENAVVAAVTLPWCLSEFTELRAMDWLWLFVLGVACTALSHALLVSSLSQLKARTAGLVIALEPIYAIAFAAMLFGQYPSLRAALGGALIIGTITASALYGNRVRKP